jgi:hypothetical protein
MADHPTPAGTTAGAGTEAQAMGGSKAVERGVGCSGGLCRTADREGEPTAEEGARAAFGLRPKRSRLSAGRLMPRRA